MLRYCVTVVKDCEQLAETRQDGHSRMTNEMHSVTSTYINAYKIGQIQLIGQISTCFSLKKNVHESQLLINLHRS